MKLLKDFTNSAISMIKRNAEDFNKMFKDLDFSFAEDRFDELESEFKERLGELKKKVKEFTDKFIVEVPFNQETETLSFKIKDGMVIVVTERHTDGFDSKSTTEISIPSGVDSNHMIQRYDSKNKKMKFIFLKKIEDVKTQKTASVEVEKVPSEEQVQSEKVAEKEALIRKMIEMHERGFSYRKIAEETGISDKTVKRWIKSALKTD